jgi:PTH1 family peptidyl-tRNA hydrolase
LEAILGSDAYPKLRFGIGNDYPKGMQADFVLSKWKEELPLVKLKIEKCIEIIESYASIGIDKTMSLYNQISLSV